MDFQQLDVLEEKVKKLLQTIKTLQSENEHLIRKCDESEKTVTKLKMELEKWSKSAEENETLTDQIEELKQEREEIRSKVERLISNLEQLELKV